MCGVEEGGCPPCTPGIWTLSPGEVFGTPIWVNVFLPALCAKILGTVSSGFPQKCPLWHFLAEFWARNAKMRSAKRQARNSSGLALRARPNISHPDGLLRGVAPPTWTDPTPLLRLCIEPWRAVPADPNVRLRRAGLHALLPPGQPVAPAACPPHRRPDPARPARTRGAEPAPQRAGLTHFARVPTTRYHFPTAHHHLPPPPGCRLS